MTNFKYTTVTQLVIHSFFVQHPSFWRQSRLKKTANLATTLQKLSMLNSKMSIHIYTRKMHFQLSWLMKLHSGIRDSSRMKSIGGSRKNKASE